MNFAASQVSLLRQVVCHFRLFFWSICHFNFRDLMNPQLRWFRKRAVSASTNAGITILASDRWLPAPSA